MKTLAKEEMSANVITVTAEASLEAAYEKMTKHKIRHLLVTDITDSIVGIISDRDLQRAMISEISGGGLFTREVCEFNPEHNVRDYMSWPIQTVTKETSLLEVVEKMRKSKISALVVTEGELVAGIITIDDLLGVLEVLLKGQEHPDLKTRFEGILANPALGRLAQLMSDVGI